MKISNRMADVVKLRSNVYQDFLKMIVVPGWQQQLYVIAEKKRKGKAGKSSYQAIYDKMRDIGPENYSVDVMDVTSISLVINFCKNIDNIGKISQETHEIEKAMKDDRNLTQHDNANVESEELYLRAQLALYNIQRFVRTVDNIEIWIDNTARAEFRKKYIAKANQLRAIINDELIELIKRDKEIQKDIESIKNSSNPLDTWIKIKEIHMQRDWIINKDPEKYYEFAVKASDAGITHAHYDAASFFLHEKNYPEFERRIYMMIESSKDNAYSTVNSILGLFNTEPNAHISDELWERINGICPDGYRIVLNTGEPYGRRQQYELCKQKKI